MSGVGRRFRLLGPVAVEVDGREVVLGGTREASLLADLLVHANEVVPTSRLVDDLWRGDAPPGAVATLHTYVRNVRRVLEPDRSLGTRSGVIASRRPGYVVHVGPDELDVWSARRLIEEGRAALAVEDARRARDLLTEALELWHGPTLGPLAGEEHLRAVATELDELRLTAIEDRVDAELAMGRAQAVVPELESLVIEHPYRERFWAQLILALYRSDRQADALRAYRRVRLILAEDLGLEPGRRLRNLESAVLSHQDDLEHTAAPIRTHRNDVAMVSRQPLACTSFVGRDIELANVASLLTPHSGVRLVTICGAGGVGKSRLALRAAFESRAGFNGGAWFVPLASVTSADAVADVVVETLGGGRQPGAAAIDAIADVVGGRHILVVVDNCEHVVGAAASCVEMILTVSDGVVVATSREPLGVPGEQVVRLSGLGEDAARQLFIDRAGVIDPPVLADGDARTPPDQARVIGEICARLDGMPLAIELAAARASSMSVSEIRDRLDDRFRLLQGRRQRTAERHQTLRAAVQWSVDLLDPPLRVVFHRLSVFRGGFLSDAAAAVCDVDGLDDFDAIDALDALVARSMIVADRTQLVTRYTMLDTLREYGRQELAARGDLDTCRQRHARHYLDLAERARRQLSTVDAGAAMAVLGREWDNLRSACEWFNESGEVDGALRMVLTASPYATQNLRFELAAWAERAIALDGAHLHDAWPAAAAVVAGFRLGAGDLSGSCALAQQAVDVESQRGLARSFETSCAVLGCATASGDRERALELAIETERIATAGGDPLELELGWYFRVISQLATGPAGLPGLERIVVHHVAATEARGNPLELGCAYSGELAYALATDRGRALELYERVRRWATLAGSRSLPANAALLMAMSADSDNPLETLAFARASICQHYDAAYWLGIRSALQPVVRALVDLGHHRAAAVLLGGLAGVYFASPATTQLAAEITPHLDKALGADNARLHEQGRDLDRDRLAQQALEAIDEALATCGAPSQGPHDPAAA